MPKLAISSLVLGVVLVALGIPLVLRKVAPNGTYGFRTIKTMSDSRIWYEANAYSGKAIVWAGVATSFLSFVFWYVLKHFLLTNGQQLLASVVIEVGPLLVGMMASFRYVSRL